ncbi:nucleotidyltransferase family protein [Prevotella pallens]|uniref:nucleotidyltransferase domain-containing protein n=1 Tax=Prevotella pallens TaxID=60133 RepID=UPI0028EC931B|nr:nucleotidyltransferase family protein [Prevotella pallens]
MDAYKLLKELIRNELWGEQLSFSSLDKKDFTFLQKIANMQTVSGLVFSSLINNNIKLPQQEALAAFGGLENIKKSNQLLNRNLIFLTELLEKYDIKFFVVKGQTVANLYPHPLHRIGGDIDFYCFSKDLERLINILHKELNIELEKDESEQHYTFQYNETLFELHFTLYKFADIENQRYFDNLIDTEPLSYVLIDNKEIPILSPTLNLAYTFLHLYHHLIELGVGLRQFCDIAILCYTAAMAEQNQNKEKSIDKERLTNILTHLDYLSAFKAIGTILIEELGLSKNYFPYQLIKQDYERKKYILSIVYKRGNFGKYGRTTEVRTGIKYYIEQTTIKLSHYYHLFNLSKKENIALITKEIPKKIIQAIRR